MRSLTEACAPPRRRRSALCCVERRARLQRRSNVDVGVRPIVPGARVGFRPRAPPKRARRCNSLTMLRTDILSSVPTSDNNRRNAFVRSRPQSGADFRPRSRICILRLLTFRLQALVPVTAAACLAAGFAGSTPVTITSRQRQIPPLHRHATLHLSGRWTWSTPVVQGRAVDLIQVNYFKDPGSARGRSTRPSAVPSIFARSAGPPPRTCALKIAGSR